MVRKWICMLLIGVMVTGLTGCGMIKEFKENEDSIREEIHELWESFVDEVNEWVEYAATHSITEDSALKGERKTGIDDYVGSYEADYDGFSGEEYIFGGTSLKRKYGSDLKVTYSLTVESGRAVLYWLDGKEEKMIADASAGDVYQFTIHAGKNFIVLRGNELTGDLSLKVE